MWTRYKQTKLGIVWNKIQKLPANWKFRKIGRSDGNFEKLALKTCNQGYRQNAGSEFILYNFSVLFVSVISFIIFFAVKFRTKTAVEPKKNS